MWACKLWSEADTQDVAAADSTRAIIKVVVYQPDSISYWVGDESGQEVRPENAIVLNGTVPENIELTNEKPWPLASRSLPIIHFANQKDNYTSYGESELRPAVPLQDVLNRTLHSMVMASELSAFRQYWCIGMNISQDGILPGAMHNLVPFDTAQGITAEQVEYMKGIRVGEFSASDISQYTNQIDKIVQQISQSTQTPIYGVTAEGNLSGEALKQLEIGLLGKIERFQHQNADAIKELIALTAEIQNTFEGENAPAFGSVNVIWKSPELLDVNARITTLVTLREKAPGLFADEFYVKRIGVLLGMSQDDINAEIENAANQTGFALDAMLGAGLVTPVA